MGDGNAPEEFALCYQVGVDDWDERMKGRPGDRATIAACPWTGASQDLAMTEYADDIARSLVFYSPSTVFVRVRDASDSLSEAFLPQGHSQNAEK